VGAPEKVEAPTDGPVAIPFRAPNSNGSWAYRLIFETSGQQQLQVSTDNRERDPIEQSIMIELEYAEIPTQSKPGSRRGTYLLRLDALHARILQSGSPPRVIEVADDRLRVMSGEDIETDLSGAQPEEGLTPRMILGQIFGLVVHDAEGNPVSVQLRGRPKVREFLGQFPLREGIAFSRIARPTEPIEPGYAWVAQRFMPNAVGALGLRLDVDYSLTGFADVDGVRCAWIRITSNEDGTDVPSALGFDFDRVKAELKGEAWIELDTSRLRRMVVFDESRAAYTRGVEPAPVSNSRMRYKGRMLLELIDPNEKRTTWAEGKPRFEVK